MLNPTKPTLKLSKDEAKYFAQLGFNYAGWHRVSDKELRANGIPPRVNLLFVNPFLKQMLCALYMGDHKIKGTFSFNRKLRAGLTAYEKEDWKVTVILVDTSYNILDQHETMEDLNNRLSKLEPRTGVKDYGEFDVVWPRNWLKKIVAQMELFE